LIGQANSWSTAAQLSSTYVRRDATLDSVAHRAGHVLLTASVSQSDVKVWRFSATDALWRRSTSIGRLACGTAVCVTDTVVGIDAAGNISAAWFAQTTANGASVAAVNVNHMK
jgi:hypothetical protein